MKNRFHIIILAFTLVYFIGCQLPTVWVEHWDDPDWIDIPVETDTIPVDTIDPLPIVDTCTGYIEYTQPEFVGLYIKFDFPQDSILWEGGGISSYDLGEVVNHITDLPFTYGSDSIGAWVDIVGTNNHQQFQLDIFTRTFTEPIYRGLDIPDTETTCYSRIMNGKWYMGTGKQELWATGSTPSEFKQRVNDKPSVDMFTFYGTNWDSIAYVQVCRQLLIDCKAGRRYADLFFIPFQLEQSLIDSFYLASWDRVREPQ